MPLLTPQGRLQNLQTPSQPKPPKDSGPRVVEGRARSQALGVLGSVSLIPGSEGLLPGVWASQQHISAIRIRLMDQSQPLAAAGEAAERGVLPVHPGPQFLLSPEL